MVRGAVPFWPVFFCFHVKELEKRLHGEAFANTKEQLFTVLKVLDIKGHIPPLKLLPEIPQGANFPPRVLVQLLENQLSIQNVHNVGFIVCFHLKLFFVCINKAKILEIVVRQIKQLSQTSKAQCFASPRYWGKNNR